MLSDVCNLRLEETCGAIFYEKKRIRFLSIHFFEMAWKQTVNKPTAKPAVPKPKFETKDDDWDTDTSYQVSFSEFQNHFSFFEIEFSKCNWS